MIGKPALFTVTDEVIRNHLIGRKTIGAYPLLLDETCWFLAADFDKKTWKEDALAFIGTCQRAGVNAYLERSRSGNGGHVWIFFEGPIPAVLARKMGCALLTQTMEPRHEVGLDSYDRFFPNQDTLPKGGFGNLIALPLQWMPRQNGNSLFVDDDLHAYPDQWQLLLSIRRVGADQVEWIVNDATRRGQVMGVRFSMTDDDAEGAPWTLLPSRKKNEKPIRGPFPESVEIVRSNLIFVPKVDLPEAMLNRIVRVAAFQNPEFYKAQAMRLPVWDKPRIISCSEEFAQHLALPRGCLQEVSEILKEHEIRVMIRNERYAGKPIDVKFQGYLRDDQAEAIRQTLRHDEGVLCAPTAFGKTVVAAKLIADRAVNTLILVHRQQLLQLLEQWRARLVAFLDLPPKAIGQVVGGKDRRAGLIDVALLQSLQRKGEVKDYVAEYGHVIADECHHLTAFSFEQVMRQVKAKFIVGLTATPTRKDGHHPIIFMQCGPIRFHLSAREAAERSPLVSPRQTDFRMPPDAADFTIQDVYAALVTSETRNQQIVADIIQAVREGRTPLVLTNRTDHLVRLASCLSELEHVLIMKGGMRKKQRQA